MAERLGTQLQSGGLEQSIHTGLLGSGLFGGASLDLNFAVTKNIGPLVSFTRASNATYIDSAGTLRTAVTNLLLGSADFSATYTSLNNVTTTVDTTVAPDGSTTGDTITGASSALNVKYFYKSISTTATGSYTASIYLKANTQSIVLLRLNDNTGNNGARQLIDLSTGQLSGSVTADGTATNPSSSITPVGNGWYRCAVTCTFNTAITLLQGPAVFHDGYTTSTSTNSYFAWGAQLEQSSTVGEYIPTTSTINSTPRFDHAITSSRTNLLLRSEEFGASWSSSNITVSPNAIVAPNGTLTADKAIATTTNSAHQLFQITSGTSGVTYAISFYAKAGEYNRFAFGPGNAAVGGGDKIVTINLGLSNPVVSQDAIFNSSAFAVPVGNGWYRVGATFTATATGTMTVAVLQTIINNAGSSSFAGDGTSGIYTWGAQLEQAATVGEYIPTTSAPVTVNTTESLGLMVEEQRTNSIRNNTMVGAVAGTPGTVPTNWGVTNTVNGLSRQIVEIGVTDGITYIRTRVSGTTTAGFTFFNIGYEQTAASAGQTWTASAYYRLHSGSLTGITLQHEVARFGPGYLGSNVLPFVPGSGLLGRQRYVYTSTVSDAGLTSIGYGLQCVVATSGTVVDFTVDIGLPQLEQGAFATSVIPTSTAAVTRSADVASITGANFSSWYRQDEGTVFAQCVSPATTLNVGVVGFDDTTANERWRLGQQGGSTTANVVVVDNNVLQGNTGAPINSFINGSLVRIAAAVAVNNVAVTGAGLSPAVNSTATLPTVTQATIGTANAAVPINGTIRRLTYWPQRLSNSTLQAITQ